MNYKLATPQERAAMKLARKRREHRRLNKRRSRQRAVKRAQGVREQLTFNGMTALVLEELPRNAPLLLSKTRAARREIRRLNDLGYFARWTDPTMPVQEILVMPKVTNFKRPTKTVRPVWPETPAREPLPSGPPPRLLFY